MPNRPKAHGLYDPRTEHDACGMGFVANLRGEKSRSIVESALEVLRRLSHRAGAGADPDTGDGAGILMQIPHRFFKREGLRIGMDMPRRRRYGLGMMFLPQDPHERRECERICEEIIEEEGQRFLGWRDVPVDPSKCGTAAKTSEPVCRQVYVARRRLVPSAFERKLYVIRKRIENRVREMCADSMGIFHIASFSAETIVYKGLLLPAQLDTYYLDLKESELVTSIAIVHSRFSTNTFPTWDLAQPFHHIAHNGEINTVRGNRNWMSARRSLLESAKFFGPLDRLFPIIVPGRSDSAQFDNMVELLHLGGRSLPHAMMMMIPEAWENDELMASERRAFYEYSSRLMEPWDGPAAVAFTDGKLVGATLDRNGLRPARYVITKDDRVILSSEVGVIDLPPEQVARKGRLRPGRMFVVDTIEGRILVDDDIKEEICRRYPYARWLKANAMKLKDFPETPTPLCISGDELGQKQRAFGYSLEDLRLIMGPMAETGKEPIGSMGTDTPLAVLSEHAPNLSGYFHQLFAQVTNPPIDPIREALVMTLETGLGPDGNTFEETPEQCHSLRVPGPILTNTEVAKVLSVFEGAFEPISLSTCYDAAAGPKGLEPALDALLALASDAVDEGHNILILSDRAADAERVAIPALLALSAVHQHLVRIGTRMQCGIIVESAEVRETHDFALLIGFGAAAVNPYLALDTLHAMSESGDIAVTPQTAHKNYGEAVKAGLRKIMSKMGISALNSYRGAQMFEAVGLDKALVQNHFGDTSSRLGGVGLEELGREVLQRHARAYGEISASIADSLPVGGKYQWRRRGEIHKWTPATIAKLQTAARTGSPELFREYSQLVDNEDDDSCTLRGQLDFVPPDAPLPLEDVEPVDAILKRFVTGAMSFGSISAEAHETLAIAMNRIGGKSNSGEGGEEERRFERDENGDLRRSAIKQVASGRFGVASHYLVNADEIQIKMAQGAKPGEGGQLPGHKVDERIARVRCSTPGVTLISPPPHHDIYSIEDLAQLIHDLQAVNPAARVSVKLVSEVGVGTVASGVAKARAGAVIISGYSGGTGASPLSSIKHTGLPWELGLAETQQVLVQNNLRGKLRVQVDGGLRTARDVVIATLLGAEEWGMATAPLIVSGCVMLRKCHLNTCSVGIATQDAQLRKRYTGNADDIVRFFTLIAEGVRELMAKLGFSTIDEMVGQVNRLHARTEATHWKSEKLDLGAIIAKPQAPEGWARFCKEEYRYDFPGHLDRSLLEACRSSLSGGEASRLERPVHNTDRSIGAMLSGEISRLHGSKGLPDDTIYVKLHGSAGQSFGCFLASGVTLDLSGDANDYVGKGLSGGRIIVAPPAGSTFANDENIIVGNTVLYGATKGEAYFSGVAGERFAVRNSGAKAVVEGMGDHGCEYMTGGTVVCLGPTGKNFAAGMSGGVAYVFERERTFRERCNLSMVDLETLNDESEIGLVYGMIVAHTRYTQSPLGERILDNWDALVDHFVKVMPRDYKRVLAERRAQRASSTPVLSVIQGGES
ncbi:MAG: glutamate synthase large subunit [Myxococcales bacterium]|nr:glutamate synthase large subunit [Myxococcales bacterium]